MSICGATLKTFMIQRPLLTPEDISQGWSVSADVNSGKSDDLRLSFFYQSNYDLLSQ